jgi:exodeoxyribonuclease V gamma subunit
MPTGLAIYTAERLEMLAAKLAAEMKASPLGPLEREVIVVQSRGMYRWLTLELAKRLGIAATIATPFPGTFARALAERIEGKTVAPPSERYEPTEPSAYERDSLAWRIFRLLARGAKPVKGPAAAYTKDDPDGRLRFQLATKLADRFDQYQLYRGDLLLAFENNEQPFDATPFRETASWQAELWRAIVAEAGRDHLARRFDDLIHHLGRADSPPSGLPSRVNVFGATALPPVFLELLGRLAPFSRVALYVVTPTPEYWTDLRSERDAAKQLDLFAARGIAATDAHVEVGNPLLTALGRQAQELEALLQSLDSDGSAREHLDSPTPSRDTVLGTLQADIAELVHRGVGDGRHAPLELPEGDRSLAIHVCHSPMREMQVLRDVILDAFARDPTLRPDQVFVLAPDIAKYAPFVEAVFGVAHEGEPTLRFTIADRTARAEEPLVDAALKLLDLVGSRVVASEVLALLDAAAVRQAARIEASEIETVRNWVTSVPIRWGMDAQHRRDALALPSANIDMADIADTADAADTWRGGLDRLLLGYAIGNEDELVAGRLPSSLAASDADLLGRFAMFVDRLFGEIDRLAHPRKLEDWARDLRASFTAITKPGDEAEESALRALLEAADRIGRQQKLATCDETVTIEIVRDAIRSELEAAGGGAGFISGGITFCSLQPMRAIPAKLIAIVGLDDRVFPRRDRPASFDLIAASPLPGDRSTKSDDRNLFLETLLAARERLVLSYVGRSQKDNRVLAPSSALVELESAIDRSFVAREGQPASAYLTVVHALQPFNERYFATTSDDEGATSETKLPRSYSAASYQAAVALRTSSGPEIAFAEKAIAPKENPQEIHLGELAEFWVNPCKHFSTRTLGLRLPGDDPLVCDAEPFALDHLERYQVSELLLERRLAGLAAGDVELQLLRAMGCLPHADLSRASYQILCGEIDDLVATIDTSLGGRPVAKPPLAVAIDGRDWRIVGTVTTLTDRGLLHCRTAKIKPKDRIRAWISHLAMSATEPLSTFLLGEHEGKRKHKYACVRMLPVADATDHLDRLVRGYLEGLSTPLPVFEKATYAFGKYTYDRMLPKGRTKKLPRDAAEDAFESGYKYTGDDADPYIVLCTRGRNPFTHDGERFETLASELWVPLLRASGEVKK